MGWRRACAAACLLLLLAYGPSLSAYGHAFGTVWAWWHHVDCADFRDDVAPYELTPIKHTPCNHDCHA